MALIGYARVSTDDQHPEAQGDALRAAGCERVFVDIGQSGRLARRPELDACLAYLRPGDVLVVTKLDRLGRSVRNLIEQCLDLDTRGVQLRVLHQGIDTTTPAGKLLFHMLAAVAEFERDLIVERTRDGLAAARARGRHGGRPRRLTPEQDALLRERYDAGARIVDLHRLVPGVGRTTIYDSLARTKVTTAAAPTPCR